MIEDRFIYSLLPIPFLVLTAIIFIRRKDMRRRIIKIGLIGGLAGWFHDIWLFADYWRPPSFLTGVPSLFTIEDFLVGFSIMALSVTIYPFLTRTKPPSTQAIGNQKKRLLVQIILSWTLPFIILVGIFKVPSPIVTFAIVAVYLTVMWIQCPRLIKQSLIVGGIFALLGFIDYFLLFHVFSHGYIERYFFLTNEPYNPTLLGFYPLLEVLWYFTWGAFAGIFIDYLGRKNRAKTTRKASKALS